MTNMDKLTESLISALAFTLAKIKEIPIDLHTGDCINTLSGYAACL